MSPSQSLFVRILRVLVLGCLGIAILAGCIGAAVYFVTHSRQPEHRAPEQEVPVVDVAIIGHSNECVEVEAMAKVIAADEVGAMAEVSGRIIRLHPDFIEGGLVKKGEILAEIDPRDYELALAITQTQVETAKADMKIEEGQQEVAKHEWGLMNMEETATELDRELALRKPNLRQSQAAVEAAEAQLAQAKLNLERTKIKAPFNAIIQSADVRVGDLASTQTQLARLVGTDTYHVLVSVPIDDLKWIRFPGPDCDEGSVAQVVSQGGATRQGRVAKLLGALEEDGLLAQVLVEVQDPLNLNGSGGQIPLLLGEIVTVRIEGCGVDDVTAIPRASLRDGDSVWVLDEESRLSIVQPPIVWRGREKVFCTGIAADARIIVSDMAAPVDGMLLEDSQEAADTPAAPDATSSAEPEAPAPGPAGHDAEVAQ